LDAYRNIGGSIVMNEIQPAEGGQGTGIRHRQHPNIRYDFDEDTPKRETLRPPFMEQQSL
jgi:hypothetical protein